MYLTLSELQKLRLYLPKKTGIEQAAKKANVCKNSIYSVLNGKRHNAKTVAAIIEIAEDDKEKHNFLKEMREKLAREDE